MNRSSLTCLRGRLGLSAIFLVILGGVVSLQAQIDLRSGVYNRLSYRVTSSNGLFPVGPNATAMNAGVFPTITPQFANFVGSAGSSGFNGIANETVVYPQNTQRTTILTRSSIGATFASGVPRYYLGNRIVPPTSYTRSNGSIIQTPDGFWRAQPVLPGEEINNATDAATGAAITVPASNDVEFYYSPHAKAVFASSSGRVEIIWRSNVPDSTSNQYVYLKESFSVSSATQGEARTIYWTEKSFNGPRVSIPVGKIFTVNPIYNDAFPRTVDTEYQVPGSPSSGSSNNTAELRTLWYEKTNGASELRAYNRTGRLMVEYLGSVQSDGTLEFLGVDVVSVEQTCPPDIATTDLGKQLLPPPSYSASNPLGYDESLVAEAVTTSSADQISYYTQTTGPDGSIDYYAEHENDSPDRVSFYWLKPNGISNPASSILSSGASATYSGTSVDDIDIKWPKFLSKYIIQWPDLTEFATYVVDPGGSSLLTNTGLRFENGNIPSIVYQSPNRGLAKIDTTTQALLVNLGSETQSKTLLKFTGTNGGVWYVPVYTTSNGTTVNETAYVGKRINPPTSDLTSVGYISVSPTATAEGKALSTSYSATAYINPFVEGIENARDGAIIPVNALPGGRSQLKVFWFKKMAAPSGEFADLYTPSVVGNYTLAYQKTTVTKETFENSSGWTTDSTLSALTSNVTITKNGISAPASLLGVFGSYSVGGQSNSATSNPVASKTFAVSEVGSNGLEVAFQLYCFDSWDNEAFRVYINNTAILQQAFTGNATYASKMTGSQTISGVKYDWTILPDTKGYLNGGNVTDQTFRVFVRAIPQTTGAIASLASLRIGFGSTLNQGSSDESFAIDDLTIRLLNVPEIVLASNEGTSGLTPSVSAGAIYNQPDATRPGYNPNEEHSLFMSGRAYALRDDLNATAGTTFTANAFTSEPQVLIQYTNPDDGRPEMAVYQVARENAYAQFDYSIPAGTQVNALAPMPLPVMPLPLNSDGNSANMEVDLGGFANDYPQTTGLETYYNRFTFKDRKGYDWIYRGPHNNGTPAMGMNWYYAMRSDFVVPGQTVPAGTVLPYLRPVASSSSTTTTYAGNPVTGTPQTIIYRPTWPANVPTLRTGETLALSKNGLPAVRGQTSARVLYQQSIANMGASNASVILHDATRAKQVLINDPSVGLSALPASLKTSSLRGKTYFQRAQPHLQNRFYFDPTLGTKGGLVLTGEFVDAPTGEDYVLLNVLSNADKNALKSLVVSTDSDYTSWCTAIDILSTRVETFRENPSKPGTYIVDSAKTEVKGAQNLSEVRYSDTAVDSYALTAQGQGTGYVTLIFGDGEAFTPIGDPISIKVIRVDSTLYPGDLKALQPSNALDEQTTLRHSGDFAARTDLFDFQWAYYVSSNGGYPPLFEYGTSKLLGNMADTSSTQWLQIRNPLTDISQSTEALSYSQDSTVTLSSTSSLVVNNADYDESKGLPGLIFKSANVAMPSVLPAQIVFSAELNADDGLVIYINKVPAVAYNLPSNAPKVGNLTSTYAQSGVVSRGLSKQFILPSSYFQTGNNTLEVALYSSQTSKPSTAHNVNFHLDVPTKTETVTSGGAWQIPSGDFSNTVVIGGDASSAFGSTALLFSDNFYTMRYKPKGASDASYSDWTEPTLVMNWVKRALAAVNPFEQRQTDLYNFAVSTDVSVITQAGKRWEGDVPVSLENINDFGLIEIYETLLNRVKSQSIDAGLSGALANTALLNAVGYLCDLYLVLGNEAYDDALNPTLRLDSSATSATAGSSRFSFEGQLPSVMSETLALLRGRDDSSLPSVQIAPVYNRLYWNYTGGIRSGESIYALNYDIKEKTGGPSVDGSINAADALYMFPQGHGDAYGHYLTAVKGYYQLLTNPNFTWNPSAESVTVLGQTVQIDYKDERKFALAASSLARCAVDVLDFTAKQNKDSEQTGWSTMRDGKTSANNRTRYWGSDEWASRAYQGAYFNWISANAMLPATSDKTGVEKIDRTTVPELSDIASSAAKLTMLSGGLQTHINTIGVAKDGMTFDISPTQVAAGKDNFEQIYERALQACLNAKNAFDQAGRMDTLLRQQNESLDSYQAAVSDQESAYEYELIGLYGTAYAGDIGAGKLYKQGYTGPDLYHSNFINLPSTLVNTSESRSVEYREPINIDPFNDWSMESIYNRVSLPVQYASKTFKVDKFSLAAFADSSMGQRSQPGKIQAALLEAYEAHVSLREATDTFLVKKSKLDRSYQRYSELLDAYNAAVLDADKLNSKADQLNKAKAAYDIASQSFELASENIDKMTSAAKEFYPTVAGLSFDATSTARGATLLAGRALAFSQSKLGLVAEQAVSYLESQAEELQAQAQDLLDNYDVGDSDKTQIIEFEHLYYDFLSTVYEVNRRLSGVQKANENVARLYAEAQHILTERETFRQRAASVIHGHRTRDVVFRDLRNEELSQYKSLFNLAQTYVYCAAKAYDYETGLLGTPQGSAYMSEILATYSLGAFSGDSPVRGTLGDPGLAGILSDLRDDWANVEGRLGFNNPDGNGTVFSLRQELFRIPTDQPSANDDILWKQVLSQSVMANVMNDPDVALYCNRIAKADGSAVPGIVIPFSTTIQAGLNFFGWPLAAGDHAFSQSTFATKIFSSGVIFKGYIGMDPFAVGTPGTSGPASSNPNAISATPYVYLIPAGVDMMRVPALGDQNTLRSWAVRDQALPLPKNIGAAAFSGGQIFTANGTLNEQLWITRKHQAFRAVDDPAYFYSTMPAEFTSSRLIGRSAWNTNWKIVIPAYSLLNNEQDGLNRFINSVSDIKLFLRTYSNSGN